METWTLQPAADFCRQLESIAIEHGFHVALTGGCLYKDGERKDMDVIFYPAQITPDRYPCESLWSAVKALAETCVVKKEAAILRMRDGRRFDVLFRGDFIPAEVRQAVDSY